MFTVTCCDKFQGKTHNNAALWRVSLYTTMGTVVSAQHLSIILSRENVIHYKAPQSVMSISIN